MTVQTSIDLAAGIITHKVTGDLLLEDVQQAFAIRTGHPEFRPEMGVLWDLSEANASRMTSNDIRRIAGQNKARLKKTGVPYKVAFLAPRDIEYGLSRMYEMFADASLVENRVFRTLEEARRWLTS
ncbi:MAG: hypothetical protein HZB87_03705 [Desulfatitalea sp.]|nr:hypothetical protein [Desulfatitalea sp.]MBI5895229.1 hypothetical protein [Desulfobacterales bacterium]